MSITQGSALPDITQTTTTAQATPEYYTDYLSDLSDAGQTAMARTSDQIIAGYDPLQDLGYSGVEDAAGSYKTELTSAQSNIGDVAGGLDMARITEFMDPYRTNVVDEMARLSQQNVQRNLLPMMKGAFVGTGNLGSQRYAGALGQSLADIQASLTGQQYGALSKGYQSALEAALKEMDTRGTASARQAEMAGLEQELGLTGSEALRQAGAERQAYEQSLLDAPLRTAQESSKLMQGFQIPTTTTETFVGPKAGLYEMSDLQQVLGVLSVLGAIKPGGQSGQSILGSIFDYIPKLGNMFEGVDLSGVEFDPILETIDLDAEGYNPDTSGYTDYGDAFEK